MNIIYMSDHLDLLFVFCKECLKCFIYTAKLYTSIGLFKMFLRWIWGIFNIQIQSDRGHKLMLLCFKIKTKTYLVFISMVVIHSACHC